MSGMDRWEALSGAAARRRQPPRSGWAEWGGDGDARPAALPSRPPRRPVAADGRGEESGRMRGRGGEEGTRTTHGGGGRGVERAGAVVAPPRTADATGAGRNAVAVAVAGGSATYGVAERVDARAEDVVVIVSGWRSMDVSEMLLRAAQAWRSRRAQREARPDALPPRPPPPLPRPVAADGRGGSGEGTTHGADGEMAAPVRTADVAVAGGSVTRGGERVAGAVVAREEKRNGGEVGTKRGLEERSARSPPPPPKRRAVPAVRQFPPGCRRDAAVPLGRRRGHDADGGGVRPLDQATAPPLAASKNDLPLDSVDSAAAATEDVKVMNKCRGTLPKAAAEPCGEGPPKEHFKGKRECEKDRMEKSSMDVATEVFGDGIMRSKIPSTARKAVRPPLNTMHRRPFSKGKEECAVTNSAPFGPKKKLKVNGAYQSKDIPTKIVSASGIAGKGNLIDEEALSLEDDDILKALAVHDGKLELYLNASSSVQRHGQHGSGKADDRREIMMLCRRFQFIRRALVHAVEQGSLKVRRADLEADKIVRKLPGFIKPGSIVGNVRGVEVGDEFLYRVELALVGLHRPYQGGIDTADHNGVLVAISIVASGGYPDKLSSSGELIYTGSGGQPAGKKQGEDQKLQRGNLALKNCIKTKTPVRVIHGFKGQNGEDDSYSRAKNISAFTYDGLYLVVDYWREGLKGYMVFKCRLQNIHAYR